MLDPNVVLGQPQPPPDVQRLIDTLRSSSNDDEKIKAAFDLGQQGARAKDAVHTLLGLLQYERQNRKNSTYNLTTLIVALGRIGPEAKAAVPDLIRLLREPTYGNTQLPDARDMLLRETAAEALGRIGVEAQAAIPVLSELLTDENPGVREESAKALGLIATGLRSKGYISGSDLRTLKEAHKRMETSNDSKVLNQAELVGAAVRDLDNWWSWIWHQAKQHPSWMALLALYPLLLLLCLAFLWLRPLWLLHANEVLANYADVTLPAWLGGIKLPLRYVTLIGFFHYSPRVLDAWVDRYAEVARRTFAAKNTVEDRKVHVPVPVVLDKRSIAVLTPAELRPIFTKKAARLLIYGEGGSGKTSLACLLAQWAIAKDVSERLCPTHLMLPVLLEQGWEPQVNIGEDPFKEGVKDQLRGLIEETEPPQPGLIEQLLKRRRVLIICDGISEMSDDSRQQVLSGVNDFANAVIITSRVDESLNNLPKSVLRPMRIRGNRLASFMEAYLAQREKRELFTDDEYFEACRRLSMIVGDREITPLLAKNYADQIVAVKEGATGDDIPRNIPDLMLNYINILYHDPTLAPDIDELLHAAQAVAWVCLSDSFRPQPARRAAVLDALGGEEQGLPLLTYMEEPLRIIQKAGPARDRIKFALDPLAEYMAGLYLINTYRGNEAPWRRFLRQVDELEGSPENIKGFLLALRDCCITKGTEVNVPNFVTVELSRRLE